MVHKPKHNVHSFRGLLGDGGQDEINLERQNVNLAYRIVKLQILMEQPGNTAQESVVSVWREEQTSIPTSGATVDFTNTDLLGAAFQNTNVHSTTVIIFDNTLFSRNLYITYTDNGAGTNEGCNYYLELEEVPVSPATLMQLKLGVARKLNLQQD